MANPRTTGLLLLLVGVLVLMGNTLDVFPPESFWAGLLTYPIGGYLFFQGSRGPMRRPGSRSRPAGQGRPAGAPSPEAARRSLAGQRPAARPAARPAVQPASPNELVLPDPADSGEGDEEFQVTSDVSFPSDLQQPTSVAEHLRKLVRLHEQGIISAEELAAAKSKLRG
jgi:hypothetical protein